MEAKNKEEEEEGEEKEKEKGKKRKKRREKKKNERDINRLPSKRTVWALLMVTHCCCDK